MERLRREFNLDIISSYPNVVHRLQAGWRDGRGG